MGDNDFPAVMGNTANRILYSNIVQGSEINSNRKEITYQNLQIEWDILNRWEDH